MLAEHAAALAREEYEYFHDGKGMTNEHIKREAQNLAVWDLQGQHFFGDRYDARRVGNMYKDGTVHYHVQSLRTTASVSSDLRILTSSE